VTHQKRVEQLHEIKRSQIKKETGQYSGSYRARAALVRATAVVCHLCGEGARLSDPWVADHVEPGSRGDTAELRAAHKSCNERRGNRPL
jgi:hypothetical protein